MTALIGAVLFDLDDTLYEERSWRVGAWEAVVAAANRLGIQPGRLKPVIDKVAFDGFDPGDAIDHALASLGARDGTVEPLRRAFTSHRPATLPAYAGAREALAKMRARCPIGLVTNGDPEIQRAKIQALGLSGCFDTLVLADELGVEFRAPHPAPFQVAVHKLGVPAADAVLVGDDPDKDIAGAQAAGIRSVRVLTGEHRDKPSGVPPWATAADVVEAVGFLTLAHAGNLGEPG